LHHSRSAFRIACRFFWCALALPFKEGSHVADKDDLTPSDRENG
jgi:hypothetical protein